MSGKYIKNNSGGEHSIYWDTPSRLRKQNSQAVRVRVLFPAQKSNIFKHKIVFKKSPRSKGGFLFHLPNFKNQLVSY